MPAAQEDPNSYLVFSYVGSLFDVKFEEADHVQALQSMEVRELVKFVWVPGMASSEANTPLEMHRSLTARQRCL